MPGPRKHGVVGGWRNHEGNKFGAVVFPADSGYFVEYDAALTLVASLNASKTLVRIADHQFPEVPPLVY